jgi:hypothetical protein
VREIVSERSDPLTNLIWYTVKICDAVKWMCFRTMPWPFDLLMIPSTQAEPLMAPSKCRSIT